MENTNKFTHQAKNQSLPSESLKNRPLPQSLDLLLHSTSHHQPKHLEIAEERPQRVAEGRRNVALDEEVAVPGEAVACEGDEREEPEVEEEGEEEEEEAEDGSDEVEAAGSGL